MADKIKLFLAVAIVGGAIAAFHILAEHSLLARVVGLLVAVVVAALIAKTTAVGASALDFTKGSLVEARKVVWPTRKETTQTTMMVMAMVVVMGVILWGFDALLSWAVKLLTGQGG